MTSERSGNRTGSTLWRLARNAASARESGCLGQQLAEFAGHFGDPQPALWRSNDTTQRGAAAACQKAGGVLVGGDHQLLDQLACPVLHLLSNIDHAFTLEHGPWLEGLEL